MKKNLSVVFAPKSIAVIGASREPGRIGYDVLKNLLNGGYEGKIYPINPKATEILGVKCYATLSDVGAPIDLAVFAAPPAVVTSTIEEAGSVGVKGAIVITAGYKEVGNVELENALREMCDKYEMALVGPNCLGVISLVSSMNASFAGYMPKLGSVGFLSQSGAVCTAVLDRADRLGIGFSHFVSMGNKAQSDESAFLEYFLQDDTTKVIGVYLEDIARPAELMSVLRRARKEGRMKPIIVLKSGRTDVGASASASHTGALAGKDEAYDAFFAQAGIIRAEKMSEFFDLIRAFANNPLPKGNRVAIVTNAGGPGVLATDAVVESELLVNTLSRQTQDMLKPLLPPASSTQNPVDLLGDAPAKRYREALDVIGSDSEVDALMVLLTPQSSTEVMETSQAIWDLKTKTGKPVVAVYMGGDTLDAGMALLSSAGVVTSNFPEEAAHTLGVMERYARTLGRTEEEFFELSGVDSSSASELLLTASQGGRTGIPESEAIGILGAYGFPILYSAVAHNRKEAEKIAKQIGKQLVLKIVSDDILHKSDAGGVRLNISPEDAGDVYEEVLEVVKKNKPNARIDGVLLVEMAPRGGVEVILGVTRDPALGHMVMVGLGGIYVEVLKDVAFGIVPISPVDARRMVDSLKTRVLLDGARGGKALDVPVLIEALGRLSRFIAEHPEVEELDMNPLLLLPKGEGARVLDARIIVAK